MDCLALTWDVFKFWIWANVMAQKLGLALTWDVFKL